MKHSTTKNHSACPTHLTLFSSLSKQELAKGTNDNAPNHVIFATFPLIYHIGAVILRPIPHHPSPVRGINKQSWF
jgi:hypothetical protein